MKLYWLMELRERAGMTQADLAEATGLSRMTINTIESGRKPPSEQVAKKIAEVMNFDWLKFFIN